MEGGDLESGDLAVPTVNEENGQNHQTTQPPQGNGAGKLRTFIML